MQIKKIALLLGLSVLLAACGSSVKLDDVPVEDRAGTAAAPAADSNAGAKSAVAPVDLGAATGVPGPANVARVVYFDYDSFVLKAEAKPVVDAHASYLKADRNRKVSLEGHTDERGGREYNLALGQKRAEAVRRALALLGVPESQMEAVSFGKEKPAAQGADESVWARNRRVEFSYR